MKITKLCGIVWTGKSNGVDVETRRDRQIEFKNKIYGFCSSWYVWCEIVFISSGGFFLIWIRNNKVKELRRRNTLRPSTFLPLHTVCECSTLDNQAYTANCCNYFTVFHSLCWWKRNISKGFSRKEVHFKWSCFGQLPLSQPTTLCCVLFPLPALCSGRTTERKQKKIISMPN